MNYNSPKYSHKANPHFRLSDEFKPPYTSPPNNGQAFSPYSYSSPKQTNRGGRMRYFNNSNPNGTPYNNYNRNNRDTYNKHNRRSFDSPSISLYYDHSMMENPWAELEKEWEEKKELESKNAEQSDTSPK